MSDLDPTDLPAAPASSARRQFMRAAALFAATPILTEAHFAAAAQGRQATLGDGAAWPRAARPRLRARC